MSVLAACGETNSDSQTDTGKEKSNLQLQEEGKLTYAMSGLYKPYNFSENGELTGFDVEIGKAIAKEMGLEPNPVTNPWESIIAGLQGQKFDAIIGSMGITAKRDEVVDFTNPYYRSGAQVFIAADNDEIKSAKDLKGKKIGVVKASTYKDQALAYSKDIVEYTSDPVALQDLPTGRVDAVITDEGVGNYAIQDAGLEVKRVGEPLSQDEMGIAVIEGNTELQKEINKALQAIIDNGTYEKISKKWFDKNMLEEK
ncbi:ABC transporter substrate-binding protein [Mechercharimyces sp. CAU 1602]|uniref:ABC transporter substrate-binding protein n=1 Tax=Mechercharimyces sp. CAU 1602 TaxID=2973933 RepID=UPI0021624321|nr:ABC transporter substrate-binding protein [Mechercharimyces sp. CAU 1602]MCS1352465.1 ABC transporter substrate-binding protein [Mechercharimyces sp. CAU 1602]